MHRITSVTPRYGGRYPARLFRACNTSHSSLRHLGGCWILLNSTAILRKQKPLLIRHFDLILKLSLEASVSLWSSLNFSRVMTVLVFVVTALFPPHPLSFSVSPILFSTFFLFYFSDFLTASKVSKAKIAKNRFLIFFSSPAPCKILFFFVLFCICICNERYLHFYIFIYIFIYIYKTYV